MHLPIQILRHCLGLAIFCALFFAGKLAATDGQRWGRERARKADSEGGVGKFFFYSGRFSRSWRLWAGLLRQLQ